MRAGLGLIAAALVAAPAAAQAQVNAEAISVEAAPTAVAGAGVAIVATVRIDPGMTVTLTPYLTAGGVLAGAVALPAIPVPQPPSGRTVRIETTASIPSNVSGVFTLAVVIDAADAVAEVNELDNTAIATTLTRVRPQRPEAQVVSVTPASRRARPEDSVAFDVNLRNVGELGANVAVSAHLSRDEEGSPLDPELGRANVTVAAGATATHSVPGVIPADLPPGRYHLVIIVDPDGAVDEVRETDNVFVDETPFVVYADALTLDTQTLPGATVTLPYHATLEASGGDGDHVFTVSQGSLPDGLGLTRAGVLAGTPTRSAIFTFTVQVASDGKTDTRQFTIEAVRSNAPLAIATREAGQGYLNMPYEQALLAGGGEAPYTWDLTPDGGVLPPGLDLTPAGIISGVPNTLGTFNFTASVEDTLGNRDQAQLQIVVTSVTNVIVLTNALDPMPIGQAVSVQLAATGGVEPYQWVALSPPPPGLSLSEDGHLVGTPTQVGRWPVFVRVTDDSRARVQDSATIHVDVVDAGDFEIEVSELPDARVRQNYEVVLSARGGQPPLHWSLSTGSFLPDDFYMVDGDGEAAPVDSALLYGFPIFDGVHAFTIRVEDAYGRQREMIYSLRVQAAQVQLEGGCRTTGGEGGLWALALLGGIAMMRRRRRPSL